MNKSEFGDNSFRRNQMIEFRHLVVQVQSEIDDVREYKKRELEQATDNSGQSSKPIMFTHPSAPVTKRGKGKLKRW